jgi:hypothetical protein
MMGHPLWSLRAAAARLLYLEPFTATRELWREFRSHRISMSSVALVAEASGSAPQWSRELGISGEVHEGLLCEVGSTVTFTTHAGPGSKLRVRCALLPRDWETSSASVEFKVTVRAHSGAERSALRVLTPSIRWSDRRWRCMDIAMPTDASGDVVVTLETRALDAVLVRLKPDTTGAITPPPVVSGFSRTVRTCMRAAWGELIVERPRTAAERKQLAGGVARRLREWGLRGTFEYARGRRRGDDEAAAYAQWIKRNALDRAALDELGDETRSTFLSAPNQCDHAGSQHTA